MTDSSYTHLLVIVDRSGSMYTIQNDMRGALDALFEKQAEVPGKCLVDYVQFDDTYEKVFADVDIKKAKATLEPRGMTALLDAVGRAVTDLGRKLAAKDEDKRPGLVQVIVVTDGHENASHDWTPDSVKALITHQETVYNWDFVFLGANMDAVAVGTSFGFNPGKSLTYDTGNTVAMASAASDYVTRSRLAGASANTFTEDEREAQG